MTRKCPFEDSITCKKKDCRYCPVKWAAIDKALEHRGFEIDGCIIVKNK